MLESSIVYLLIRTVPESIILILSGTILLDVKIERKELFIKGCLLGVVIHIIRSLPINFGVHTVLSMIVFGLLIFRICNKELVKIIITTLLVSVAGILSEGIYVAILTGFFSMPFETLMDKESLEGAIITLPSLLIIILLVIIFRTTHQKIKKI